MALSLICKTLTVKFFWHLELLTKCYHCVLKYCIKNQQDFEVLSETAYEMLLCNFLKDTKFIY